MMGTQDLTYFPQDSKIFAQPMPVKIGTHQFKVTNAQ